MKTGTYEKENRVALAARFRVFHESVQNGNGTAGSGLYGESAKGTVQHAGAAFDATIRIGDGHFFLFAVGPRKDLPWADLQAYAATLAFLGIIF